MNKKGDIPITILVIGIFLVCTLAIASFLYADNKFKRSFFGLNSMDQINSDIDQFYSYKNLGFGDEEAVKLIGAEYDSSGKIIIIKDLFESRGFFNSKTYDALHIEVRFKP